MVLSTLLGFIAALGVGGALYNGFRLDAAVDELKDVQVLVQRQSAQGAKARVLQCKAVPFNVQKLTQAGIYTVQERAEYLGLLDVDRACKGIPPLEQVQAAPRIPVR